VIYLDSSVALAQLLAEDRRPPDWLWGRQLVASRLLQFEVWNRIHAYGRSEELASEVITFINLVLLIELETEVLARALDPLPGGPRTLDALHLATACFVRDADPEFRFASYDRRMLTCAGALDLAVVSLD
jgi:uncharacterized protein